jgi:geranylgeranyl diphosphate synthase type II
MAVFDIIEYLKEKKALVDSALTEFFPDTNPLFQMMRYSIEGGKRIRPILAITSYQAAGGDDIEQILPIACGLELIHTYSLIHDDLPCMDNDDLRRGKASSHKRFGEAQAILAGDGLFAYAFELLTRGDSLVAEKLTIARAVSQAVGPTGVVYGQLLDIDENRHNNPHILRMIHLHKTAKFIAVSLLAGAILAQANTEVQKVLQRGGLYLGILFQYTDDILDIVGEKSRLGKTPGKDSTAGKLTAPAVYGLEGARFRAKRYAERAIEQFKSLGELFQVLCAMTTFILNRTF